MRMLLAAFALLAFSGCTSKTPVCDAAKAVAGSVSQVIATQLSCKNPDAITASLVNELVTLKVCTSSGTNASGLVGDLICPNLVTNLYNGALKKIPADWQCGGGAVGDQLKAQLLAACKSSFPF